MDAKCPQTVTILGGNGVMGQSIALALIGKGTRVRLWGRSPHRLTQAMESLWSSPFGLEQAVIRGKMSHEQAQAQKALLMWTTDLVQAVHKVDLVIESVSESVELKRQVLRDVEPLVTERAIIASNTSSIMVAEMAGALRHPERLLAAHWFYPANIMRLVEVVPSRLTSRMVLFKMVSYLKQWDKVPQVVKDSPGFFMTRFINNFVREAWQLVDEGVATADQVDLMLKEGLGWPMGVFELQDSTGSFEAWYKVQQYLFETLGDRYNIPTLARACFMAGYRGDPNMKPGSQGTDREFLGHHVDYRPGELPEKGMPEDGQSRE